MYSIIGCPIEHSKSPQIYNYLFKYFGLNKTYTKNTVTNKKNLHNAIKKYEGVNITYPYKEEAAKLCDKLDSYADKTKSVNTIINIDGKLKGINTDGIGFANSIEEFNNIQTILIIGAGSTAKSAAFVLSNLDYIVAIVNRSSLPLMSFEGCLVYPFNNYNKNLKPDLVVNMTTVGLEDDLIPFPLEIEKIIESSRICIDLIYGRETKFMKMAKEKGKIVRDGTDLLKAQAAIVFQHFTKFKIPLLDITKALKELEI